MPRIMETTVYTYDELSEKAQARAREWFARLVAEMWDADDTLAEYAAMLTRIGVTLDKGGISYSGFSRQGDGASFTGHYSYADGAMAAVADWPNDAKLRDTVASLEALQNVNGYELSASLTRGNAHYSHEFTVAIDVVKGPDDEPATGAAKDDVIESMRDLMRWVYKALETEYDYRQSDEAVVEGIRANEYEFTADGKVA